MNSRQINAIFLIQDFNITHALVKDKIYKISINVEELTKLKLKFSLEIYR